MKLAINVNDEEYAQALSLALSRELKNCEIEIHAEEFDYEITSQQIKPLEEICAEIESVIPGSWGRTAKTDFCRIVLFCSANGGTGVSSAARTFARQQARLRQKRVFYLCLSRIAFVEDLDEYGVRSFSSHGGNPLFDCSEKDLTKMLQHLSGENDFIVLDLPFSSPFFRTAFYTSDQTVVVFYPGRSCRENEFLLERLRMLALDESLCVYDFRPCLDEYSFFAGLPDIHGEFGAEVNRLAKRMEQDD